jgi:hypothetical protein
MRERREPADPVRGAADEGAAMPPQHDLGILFVHGIGDQPEGSTLLAFGEPLIQWLNRWLRREATDPRLGVSVVKTLLTPSKLHQQLPPHAELHVELPPGAGATNQSWLIAESWWSGEVKAPAFGKLAGWMMTVGAWSLLSHVSKGVRRRKYHATRIAMDIVALLVWLVLAACLQLSVLALSVFALLPIPGARKVLSGVLLALTGVLGDSYVLLESSLQRSAIVEKTREALRWLGARCDRVIVVAHSQGAAIAHFALRDADPRNVHTLLTFGSGLGKLEELLRLSANAGRVATIARLSPVFLVLFALTVRITIYEQLDDLAKISLFVVGVMLLFAAIFVIVHVEAHWKDVESWIQELSLRDARPGLVWIDVHASRDLVPNGVLSPVGARVATSEPRVVNLGSVLRDHTSYWQNRAEFVPTVLRAIGRAANLELFPRGQDEAFAQAARAHEHNVRWLSVTMWATVASVALVPFLFWEQLAVLGPVVDQALLAMGGPFEKSLKLLESVIAWWNPSLPGAKVADAKLHVLGTLLVVALIVLWRMGYGFVWRWWDERTVERLFRPKYLDHPVDRLMVDLVAVTAGLAPLLIVGAWPFVKTVLIGHVIAGATLIFYSIMLALFVGRVSLWTINAWPLLRNGDKNAWKESGAQLGGLGMLVSINAFILPAMFDGLAWLRGAAITAMVAVMIISAIVAFQRTVMARLDDLTRRRDLRWIVIAAPALMTLWMVSRMPGLLRDGPLGGGTGNARRDVDLWFTPFTTYLALLAVVWGVLWVARRWQRRARRT